jgi:hypothetical protein
MKHTVWTILFVGCCLILANAPVALATFFTFEGIPDLPLRVSLSLMTQ